MEKDIAFGSAGGMALSLGGGLAKAVINVNESVLSGAIVAQASVSASMSALAFVDLFFAEIEAKLPPGYAPIEESIKGIVKSAVAAIV